MVLHFCLVFLFSAKLFYSSLSLSLFFICLSLSLLSLSLSFSLTLSLFYLGKTVWLFVSSFKRSLRTKFLGVCAQQKKQICWKKERRRSLWKTFLRKKSTLVTIFNKMRFYSIHLGYVIRQHQVGLNVN